MKIDIILPYKEVFSGKKASAVSHQEQRRLQPVNRINTQGRPE